MRSVSTKQNILTIIDVFTKYAQAYPINGKTAVEVVEKLIENILTIIDVFTKYAQAYPINGKTAVEVVEKLIERFSIHGTPQQIVMDNGLEFNNATLKELLKLYKVLVSTEPLNKLSWIMDWNSTMQH
ncbi:hypothetical protein QE152_g34928 [Popillia japonica]|uniref:Integrase catalytic domain-containing protein n=1 Tax=Popillia japonica TaxID=7064 RepID=A0AAW1ISS7_POPJA